MADHSRNQHNLSATDEWMAEAARMRALLKELDGSVDDAKPTEADPSIHLGLDCE